MLYTMALAGIFAACTQDEFETVNGADALAGRKSIGKVTFTEAPSTRWAVDAFNSIMPEAGDAFSLMLVDNPRTGLDGQHLYPIDNYELVNKVQTNYIFKNNGNDKWDSEAELVEGNYLYVAPAQEGKLDRNTVEITLPTEQNLSLGADGKIDPLSAIKEFVAKKYPFYIGHRFLSEGGSVSLPMMQHIFAYPEITITNSDAFRDQTAIVTKVIIKQEVATDAFVINAPLNAENTARLLTNEFFADREKTETSKDKVVIGNWAGHANQYFGVDEEVKQEWKNDFVNKEEIAKDATFEARDLNGQTLKKYLYNNGLEGATSELLGTPTSKSQYIVINMPGEGIALKYGESIKFNAIIPADHYTMTSTGDIENPERLGLTLYAVLDNNEAYKKVVDANNSEIDMYPGKRYPNQDYTGLEVKGDKGLYFTVDVCNGKTDGVGKYVMIPASEIGGVGTINSTDALVAAIKAHTSTENLNLTVEGRNVVYNKEVNDAVANTNCQNVNIQGHIKVQAETGTTLTINSRVNIEDAVIEKGGKIVANENSLKEVLVSRDAELELEDVKSVEASQAVIYNTGILTLSTADFVRVDNYGKLNVNANLASKTVSTNANDKKNINILYAACGEGGEIISPSINLKPEVEIMAGGVYKISDALNYEITVDAKTANEEAGKLQLADRTQIVKNKVYFGNKEVTKEGNIINYGMIEGKDQVLVVYPGLEMTIEKDGVVKPQVMIRGASRTLSDLSDGPVAVADYVPAAVVYNNGTMNAVRVDGKLIMGADSRVDGNVTAADNGNTDGEIDNTARGILAGRVSKKVTVFAEFKGLDLTTAESGVAERAKIKAYAEKYQVSVIRLTGALNMGDENRSLMEEHCGKVTLEFAQGSSLNIGYAKLTSDLDITVTGKNIEWKGNTVTGSTFNLTAGAGLTKGQYLTIEDGKYTVAVGNVWFRNCQVVDALGSDTPLD